MSNIFKSSEVIIDSKKYILTEKVKVENKEEKKEGLNSNQVLQDLTKIKEDILEESKKESDEILKGALKEKELMLSDAYDEAINIRDKARKEGFDEGKIEALKSMEEKERKTTDDLLKYKNDVIMKYNTYFESGEEAIIKLVIDSVEEILNKNIEEDKNLIKNLVRKGIENSTFAGSIVIRVCIDDYENALANKSKILIFSKNINSIKFVTDYALVKGECIIESEVGNIDVGVGTQFEKLKELYYDLIKD